MKRSTSIFLLFTLLILNGSQSSAQEASGGTRPVFTLGAGSRAISLGGAFTATGNDPSVIYYYPAALRLNAQPSIMLNHIQLFSGFSDANYDFLGAVYPTLDAGALGIGVITTGTGGIRQFDENSIPGGEISYRESQGMIGYAFNLPYEYVGRFTVGTSVKVLHQKIGEFSDTGAGLDVGLLYRHPFLKGFVVGCNLQDIVGAEIKLQSISEKTDRTIMAGIGYSYIFEDGSSVTASAQVDMPERADRDTRFGVEYTLKNMFSVRLGFDSESITAGVGFNWRGYKVDYGYFSREEAGSSHPITLSVNLDESIEAKKKAMEARRRAQEEQYLREVLSGRMREHLEKGKTRMEKGEFEKAYDELKMVLEYDPSNEEATRLIGRVEEEILELEQREIRSAEQKAMIDRHIKLGLQYYRNNEYVLSREEWKALLEIDPENETAQNYLEKIREILDEQIEEHRKRALDYERRGLLAESLDEWNMIRTLNPGDQEAQSNYQRIKTRMTELGRSLESARKELESIDLFEQALNSFSRGDYPDAAEFLRKLLRIEPDHQEGRKLLDRVERRMTPLSEEEKDRIRQLYIRGMEQFNQERYKSAIDIWGKVLEIDPDNESIRKNIEEARTRLDKIDSEERD